MTTQTKPTVSRDLILAARHGLLPVGQRAWLGGFGNMLWKELRHWWGTRLWWVQTLIWVFIINGVTTIVMNTEGSTAAERYTQGVGTFLPMCVIAVSLGIVITMQGAIVEEKQLGTAAWVMSKPASRSAFILSKLLAYIIGFGVCATLIPSAIFITEVSLLFPGMLSLPLFLAGLGVTFVHQLFYMTLILMLGALFESRGPIAGIGIAMIMSGTLLRGFLPQMVMIFTPWPIQDIVGGLAVGASLPAIWPVPVILSIVWVAVMLAVALWRFNQAEF